MTSCRLARTWILRELDRDLSVDRALELEAHLAACAACRRIARHAAEVDEALLALAEPPLEKLDVERSVRAIRGRLEDADIAHGRTVRRRRTAGAFAAAAAAVVALAWVILSDRTDPRAPSQDEVAQQVAEQPAEIAQSPAPANPETTEPSPTSEQVPEPAPTIAASNEGPVFDPQRLEATREEVRAVLRDAAARLPELASREAALELAAEIDAARSGALAGWPIVRIASGLTVDPDPSVARAAKRYLGVRGDRLAQRALQDRWTDDNDDREALLALLDVGEPALEVLARACRSPRASAFVRGRLGDGAFAIRVFDRALRDAEGAHGELEVQLLADLARLGEPAVASLLQLCRDDAVDRTLALDALERMPSAPRVLTELVRANPRAADTELLIAACARVRPPGAIDWLAEQCREMRTRPTALAALGAYDDPQAFEKLLDLQRESHLERVDLDVPVDALLARGSEHVTALADHFLALDVHKAGQFLELLVERGDGIAAPSLARLAASDELPEEDRELAARAVGDFGRVEDARQLAGVFGGLTYRERRLAAVCVDSIHRLGGERAVSDVLAGGPRRHTDRVLDVLRKRSPDSVSLVQLERALDPLLEHGPSPIPGTHP